MTILIVDDEKTARYGIRKALEGSGEFLEAENLSEARRYLEDQSLDLILLDLNLGGENGFDLLPELEQSDNSPKVVVITAHGDEKVAVEAMKQGAFDYLAKPFDVDELRAIVRNIERQVELSLENQRLRAQLAEASGYGDIVGDSPAMRRVYGLIDRVAETDVTVLIRGESGSGKELVARELHERSLRSGRPLVSVNCAAIPENLMESELFGHEKGAFTGASERRVGKFEKARGGTLFLDEIGDMAPETQAKILRVLEEKKIERLGSNDPIEVDVRIISATNQDLEQMVEEKKFRQDLYYRLEVVQIELPPLRGRRSDIPRLVEHFASLFAVKHKRDDFRVGPEALALLVDYPFPGNVRQLRNLIERLVILSSSGRIDKTDLPPEIRLSVASGQADAGSDRLEPLLRAPYRKARQLFETRYLLWNLRENENNITHTADAIGIHRQSLQQKIKDLELRELMD